MRCFPTDVIPAITCSPIGAGGARRSSTSRQTNSPPIWTTFAKCIASDKVSPTAGEEGLKVIKIMMAAYESAKIGKTIKIV